MAEPQVSDDDLRVDDRGVPAAASKDSGGGQSILDMVSDKDTTRDLERVQREKVRAEERELGGMEHRLEVDRSNAQHFLHREGVGPDDLQKWDAQRESQKYQTDPLQSFGSLASVFAIAASAFTKAPMENALNGSAAALNAVRANDDKAYDRAYQAWKDNTNLLIKRHELMHADYQDALQMFNTDMQLGEAKLKAMAAKYGDQQTLTLMEHGYFPQMVEMMASRAQAAAGMQKVIEESDEYTIRKQAFDQAVKQNPNMAPAQKLGLFQNYMGAKTDAEQQFNIQYWAAHPPTGDPKADYDSWLKGYKEFKAAQYPYRNETKPGSKQQLVVQLSESIAQEHPEWSPAQISVEANRQAEEVTTKRTAQSASQQTVDQKAQEIRKADPSVSQADAQIQAQRFVKLATQAPSGNRLDDMQKRVDQIKYADETISKVEDMLKRHGAITGLGGKLIGRPTEVIGNVIGGSNSTDYKQFERFVNELQLMLPRILTDSTGRPLGVEAQHIQSIVAGLSAGDTVQGTMRNFKELQSQLREMKQDTEKRLHGGGDAGSTAPPPAGGSEGGQPRWMSAPVVQ